MCIKFYVSPGIICQPSRISMLWPQPLIVDLWRQYQRDTPR